MDVLSDVTSYSLVEVCWHFEASIATIFGVDNRRGSKQTPFRLSSDIMIKYVPPRNQ
jgi:hypothetical protein